MDTIYFFFMMLFSFIFLNTNSLENYSTHQGPKIISPFSIQENCSYPGFKLACRENQTFINFPSYRNLVVKSISYDTKRINLLDPKNCVHEVFLNLDLSSTPFEYYYVLKSYTYVNCSARLSRTYDEIPCLGGPHHHVYTVESVEELPSFCKVVKTKRIPFLYSPYLSDNSFGLGFTWDLNGYEDCEAKRHCFSPWLGKVIGLMLIILVAAILISVKTHFSKIAWDYSVANVNESKEQEINYHFGNEYNGNDKETLSA